ncbi:hypothetical protein [Halosimplex halobium]|uniref:hypothetical protein n=1 Tax=Halosimplex halobium TaxID=3396618 RepID=UPI003F565D1A
MSAHTERPTGGPGTVGVEAVDPARDDAVELTTRAGVVRDATDDSCRADAAVRLSHPR